MDLKITGLDTETTGLKQEEGHRIIEIAMLTYRYATREVVDKLVLRINPERPIDPGAQAVHGISFGELVDCPTWKDVAEQVSAFMARSDVLVAHNAGFDMPFIVNELLRVGVDVPDVEVFDTLDARWATPLGKKPNLGELCFALDVPYDKSEAHAAEYDVAVMMQSFFKGVDLGFFKLDKVINELKEAA